jgi:hypothetical protein
MLAQRGSLLHTAVSLNHLESVQLLLQAGADPNALDAKGRTPLSLQVEVYAAQQFATMASNLPTRSNGNFWNMRHASLQIVNHSVIDEIRALLLEHGAEYRDSAVATARESQLIVVIVDYLRTLSVGILPLIYQNAVTTRDGRFIPTEHQAMGERLMEAFASRASVTREFVSLIRQLVQLAADLPAGSMILGFRFTSNLCRALDVLRPPSIGSFLLEVLEQYLRGELQSDTPFLSQHEGAVSYERDDMMEFMENQFDDLYTALVVEPLAAGHDPGPMGSEKSAQFLATQLNEAALSDEPADRQWLSDSFGPSVYGSLALKAQNPAPPGSGPQSESVQGEIGFQEKMQLWSEIEVSVLFTSHLLRKLLD